MIDIVKQTLEFYLKNKKAPELKDINVTNKELLEEKKTLFITLYKEGEIVGCAGSVKEIETSVVLEIIGNTIAAFEDKRFPDLEVADTENIKVRIDEVVEKKQLKGKAKIKSINPINSGIIVIKGNYDKLAVILPNISKNIVSGNDFYPILSKKLGEKFDESKYINYELITKQTTNF